MQYPWGCIDCSGKNLGYSAARMVCKDCGSENIVEEGTVSANVIAITQYPTDVITTDVGWISMSFYEHFGITSILGVSGFSSPEHFKEWAADSLPKSIGDFGRLEEYDVIELDLYQTWMPSLDEQFPPNNNDCFFDEGSEINDHIDSSRNQSYLLWSLSPSENAKMNIKTKVYALKEKTLLPKHNI